MSIFALFTDALGVGNSLLATVATVLEPVGGVATAIVVLTIGIRLMLGPLRYAQIRASIAQTALAPRLRELAQRHKGDPERLGAETLALYRSEGASPFGGFLPMLGQAPLLAVVYRTFSNRSLTHGPASLPGHRVLGVGLDQTMVGASAHGWPAGSALVFGCLLGLLALLAWWSGRRVARYTDSASPLTRIMPFSTVLIAALAPAALGIYFVTSTGYTLGEEALLRRVLARRGPSRR